MSEQLKRLAKGTLATLGNKVSNCWASKGYIPEFSTVDEAAVLADRYTQARKAYDNGQYLACIELATAETSA